MTKLCQEIEKINQWGYKTKVCPEIGKIRAYTIRTNFQTYFRTLFKLVLQPLLGLSWNTDICRTEELRAGCFSFCL